MAVTQWTFTLRAGVGNFDAEIYVNGSRFDIDRALAAGGGSIVTTDPVLAARLTELTTFGGKLFDVAVGSAASPAVPTAPVPSVVVGGVVGYYDSSGTFVPVGGGSGGLGLKRTSAKTANYTAAAGDLVPCNPAAAFTVTLPSAPADGASVAVKIVTTAAPFAVTVAASGADTLNRDFATPATSFDLTLPGEGVLLTYDAATKVWTLVARDVPLSQLDLRYPAAIAKTKRVTMAIAASPNNTTASVTDFVQRFPILLPVTTTRWRLRVSNSTAAVVALTDAYLCDAVIAAGIWDGLVSNPVSSGVGAGTIPDATTEFTTAWVTDPSLQFTADQTRILSQGFTTSGGTSNVRFNTSPMIGFNGAGAAAAVASTGTPPGTKSYYSACLDLRLEYEFVGSEPVVLVIGDSLDQGFVDDTTMRAAVPGPTMARVPLAGMRERFVTVNASVGGKQLSNFNSASSNYYSRFDLATTPPDVVIIASGYNDAVAVKSKATFITDFQNALTAARTFNSKVRAFVGTVIPTNATKAGLVTVGAASGVTTLTTSIPYANGEVVDIGYGTARADVGLTVSGASTGAGPYVTTFTTPTTKAHSVNDRISLTTGSRHIDYNAYLRSVPAGCEGVFDYEAAVMDPLNPGAPRFELAGTGSIHPGQGAMAAQAERVRIKK